MTQKAFIGIWLVLMALVAVSASLGSIFGMKAALTGIFAIAAFKAYLVLAYYMNLKPESLYIKLMLIAGIVCLAVLFWGLVPDIVMDARK